MRGAARFSEVVSTGPLGDDFMERVFDDLGKTQWKCIACDKVCKLKSNLREHIEAKHLKGTIEHKCTICPNVYRTEASFRQHVSNKHPFLMKQKSYLY